MEVGQGPNVGCSAKGKNALTMCQKHSSSALLFQENANILLQVKRIK
jgi:hypothetical protein